MHFNARTIIYNFIVFSVIFGTRFAETEFFGQSPQNERILIINKKILKNSIKKVTFLILRRKMWNVKKY